MPDSNNQQQTPMEAQYSPPPGPGQSTPKDPYGGEQGKPPGGEQGKPPGGDQKPPNGKPPGGGYSTGQSPEDRLSQLKEELEADQKAGKKTDRLQAEVTQLEKLLKDNKSSGDEYAKKYTELVGENNCLSNDYLTMEENVKATVSDTDQTYVKDVIKKIQDKIYGWQETISKLDGKTRVKDECGYWKEVSIPPTDPKYAETIAYAETEYELAQTTLKEVEDEYDREKNLVKRVTENLSKMKDYKKSAEDEDSKKNKKRFYFYFLEWSDKHTNSANCVRTKTDHRTELDKRWAVVADKKKYLREKEVELNKRKVERELAKKNVEAAQKNRTADILDKLTESE